MTNGEKYKTAQERAEALLAWCKVQDKSECQIMYDGYCLHCAMKWLDLEAEEEKPLPCPFCGGRCATISQTTSIGIMYRVSCNFCSYTSMSYVIARDAIAAHNRVAKAVKEVKE